MFSAASSRPAAVATKCRRCATASRQLRGRRPCERLHRYPERQTMTTIDPVCGMPVSEAGGVTLQHGTALLRFCSEFCKRQFERNPVGYGAEPAEERHPLEVSQR